MIDIESKSSLKVESLTKSCLIMFTKKAAKKNPIVDAKKNLRMFLGAL